MLNYNENLMLNSNQDIIEDLKQVTNKSFVINIIINIKVQFRKRVSLRRNTRNVLRSFLLHKRGGRIQKGQRKFFQFKSSHLPKP